MHSEKRFLLLTFLFPLMILTQSISFGVNDEQSARTERLLITDLSQKLIETVLFVEEFRSSVADSISYHALRSGNVETKILAIEIFSNHLRQYPEQACRHIYRLALESREVAVQQYALRVLEHFLKSHPQKISIGLFGSGQLHIPTSAERVFNAISEIGGRTSSAEVLRQALSIVRNLEMDPYYWDGLFYRRGSTDGLLGWNLSRGYSARTRIVSTITELARALKTTEDSVPHAAGRSTNPSH